MLTSALCTLTLVGPPAPLPSNCALRNPDRQIYQLFPDATRYLTVGGEIPIDDKSKLEKRLGMPIGYGEIGRSSMCIVFKGRAPIGFVHARAEVGRNGTIELVWAVDLDYRLVRLQMQRSREAHTDDILRPSFQDILRSRDFKQVRALLLGPRASLDRAAVRVPDRAASLARTALVCAAKTLLIIEEAFGERSLNARLIGKTHTAFPGTAKITAVDGADAEEHLQRATPHLGRSLRSLHTGSIVLLRARDEAGRAIGWVVGSRSRRLDVNSLIVAVGVDGRVRAIYGLPLPSTNLTGKQLDEIRDAGDPGSVRVAEALALVRAHERE